MVKFELYEKKGMLWYFGLVIVPTSFIAAIFEPLFRFFLILLLFCIFIILENYYIISNLKKMRNKK